jgi:hypothetical protein
VADGGLELRRRVPRWGLRGSAISSESALGKCGGRAGHIENNWSFDGGISWVWNFDRSLYRCRWVLRFWRRDLSMSMMYTGEESVESIPTNDGVVVYINVSKRTRP